MSEATPSKQSPELTPGQTLGQTLGQTPEQRVNDLGGRPGGPIDQSEHASTLYEKRVDALVMLLISPRIGAFKIDALRRAIEQNTAEDYRRFGYYDKWIRAVRDLLIEQEVISQSELDARIAEIEARGAGPAAGAR